MKVSIIIPVYNVASYVGTLLEDIQKQSYKDFEVIIIDDGSTDNSGDICDEYVNKDARLRCIHTKNQGVSAARNMGIENARGEYLLFFDPDDRVAENLVENMILILEAEPEVDLVISRFHQTHIFENNSLFLFQSNLIGKKQVSEMVYDFSMAIPSFYYGVVWNKLYRKSIIDRESIRFDTEVNWSEDYLFNLQYYRVIKKCYYSDSPGYTYCYREGSLCNTPENITDEVLSKRISAAYELLSHIDAGHYSERVRSNLLNYIAIEINNRMCCISTEKGIFNWRSYKYFKNYLIQSDLKKFWDICETEDSTIVYKMVKALLNIDAFFLLYTLFYVKKIKRRAINKINAVRRYIKKNGRKLLTYDKAT